MIHLSNISKQYGSQILYKQGSFQINRGEKIGLVGPNGAGKSTLFKIITGHERVDSGHVAVPEKCVVGYFSQDVADMKGRSVLDEVKSGLGAMTKVKERLQFIENRLATSAEDPLSDEAMEKILEEYGELQTEFEKRGGYELDSKIKEILHGLGFEVDDFSKNTDHFSGGWKMRIELAKMLALNPDVLLMDEPTNHLDMESIQWLEGWLIQFPGAILMTSHDRDFMNKIVSKIVEVANKSITNYSGNYDFYETERKMRRDQLISAHARQQEMLAKEEDFIARFAARASHAAQVQSRVKKIEKIERVEIPPEDQAISFEFPEPKRSGDIVVKMENLSKVWLTTDGKEKNVFQGASGVVNRQDKIAVVGVNGAGKSTLLKIISDFTSPTKGQCQIGVGVKVGYFSQSSLDVLDSTKTVFQEVQDRIPQAGIGFIRNLLALFLFRGDDVEKKVSVLSGGEKSRIVLATLFAVAPNFLILDEPTNHLDMASREVLLTALKKFNGTIMVVSHDRYFLRSLVTRVFELDKNQLNIYDRHYDDYVWKKNQTLVQSAKV